MTTTTIVTAATSPATAEHRNEVETVPELFWPVPSETARERLGRRMDARIGLAETVTIGHPAETRLLKPLNRDELESFARAHGLHVVRRVGGRFFEFSRRASLPR